VTTADALQLRSPNATLILFCFYYNAHAELEVAQPIRCHIATFLLLICYVLLWPGIR